ncbi:PQQ-dependent sugar dehydrogenase [Halorientalis halophila]|uniref:PQQ-dependent sugar dehydrogenase n=1 Tax=Halorientalis halophila TaxID=3108499 RepID=UPI003009AB3D
MRRRRDFLRVGAVTVGATLAGCSFLDSNSQPETNVGTEAIATGFTAPLGMEPIPDSNGFFVADQAGQIHLVGSSGRRERPVLDLTDRMVDLNPGYDERGLLGIATGPNFAERRRLFVRYSAPLRSGMPEDYSHTFVLSSFAVDAEGRSNPDSERIVLEIPQPQANHNAGSITFGPDEFLYVGVGDGGGGNDVGTGHVEDWYDGNPGGNGQDVSENLLGSVLRIDVREGAGGAGDSRAYGIPDDNPLVGRDGLDEHFAWGFRNPWRFSFTDGRFFVADVGQNLYEEVSIVESGGNYGWNVREGAHCFDAGAPGSPPEDCPAETPDGSPLREPIVEYAHEGDEISGISVIGGYFYTGGIGPLADRYVFGDYRADGTIFTASEPDDGGLWDLSRVALDDGEGEPPGEFLLAFGRDADGELYVLTTDEGGPRGSSGAVHRLVAV